ncbi:hypothetical protein [Streptomyces sp. JJ36]|uniref:hypothetical protein n=1 Tax=Streptomyces sp. JJ36 TaxID=2736645 RepID=UPI001F28AE15|nr:hypothetical protein [Streptomyces sp. JJ36]MCF6525229.1 hypothetical protein [Streptomyces sp. JJ36]
MNELDAYINQAAELSAVDVDDADGTFFSGATPVLVTPAAFLGGVAIASATVAAFEAGQG